MRHLPAHLLRPVEPLPGSGWADGAERRLGLGGGGRGRGAARVRGPERPDAHIPGPRAAVSGAARGGWGRFRAGA